MEKLIAIEEPFYALPRMPLDPQNMQWLSDRPITTRAGRP